MASDAPHSRPFGRSMAPLHGACRRLPVTCSEGALVMVTVQPQPVMTQCNSWRLASKPACLLYPAKLQRMERCTQIPCAVYTLLSAVCSATNAGGCKTRCKATTVNKWGMRVA